MSLLLNWMTLMGTLGFIPDLDPLLAGSYKDHGWDLETGMPGKETLENLGLEFTLGE
ncbi:MAG: hypothetical protein MUO54_14290 [Anaerolineales bacterium]|nr:hypothetical protein [Anaerolineales bacterium]